MTKSYSYLSAEERAAVMIESGKDASMRSIARLLGRSASSISRELARMGLPAAYDDLSCRIGPAIEPGYLLRQSVRAMATRQQ